MSLRKQLEQEMAAVREANYKETAEVNRIVDMYNEQQKADLEYLAMMANIDLDDEDGDINE
ncbi:MAG: hypothetical protein II264_11925 [Ruminococcus sp.]|nr:hypothetical protein [Ruminococcus sp.]